MNKNRSSNRRGALIRSNSSRGSVFGTLEKDISHTFSMSSNDDDDEICPTETFYDEEVEDDPLIEPNNHRFIPDLQVPLEKARVPREASRFAVETMVRRDETKTQFVMYLQSTEGAYPIFCAQKHPDGGQFLIKSVDSTYEVEEHPSSLSDATAPAAILGSLVKKKTRHCVTYELLLHEQGANLDACPPLETSDPLVVATMDYDQAGKARYLLEGSKPRRARISILGKESMLVETKRPNQEANGQKVMDFGGRGLEKSSKNAKLAICPNDDEDLDACCLQMVKWKENEFNVDFGSPFDAFHAFAFALAQFDY